MNIDLIPNGAIKRVHVSQNDVGRTLTFELFNNSTSYTVPSGATVKIQGTKPSGFGFSETCTVSGNVATIDTTEEMTDEYGYIQTELSISYDDVVIGTSNFVLAVEKNPHPSNTTDGTQITAQSLQVQINELAEAIESVDIETDTTLSISGKPADAKVVGDAIADIGSGGSGGGQPTVATQANEMSDTDTIYLYLGNEEGYDYGYIYVYLDGAWTKTTLYGQGQDGTSGEDGFSPIATVTQTATGATISITDEDGTTTASISNGTATDEQVETYVDAWLDEHPEAVTTLHDNSVNEVKLSKSVQEKIGYEEFATNIVVNSTVDMSGQFIPVAQSGWEPKTNYALATAMTPWFLMPQKITITNNSTVNWKLLDCIVSNDEDPTAEGATYKSTMLNALGDGQYNRQNFVVNLAVSAGNTVVYETYIEQSEWKWIRFKCTGMSTTNMNNLISFSCEYYDLPYPNLMTLKDWEDLEVKYRLLGDWNNPAVAKKVWAIARCYPNTTYYFRGAYIVNTAVTGVSIALLYDDKAVTDNIVYESIFGYSSTFGSIPARFVPQNDVEIVWPVATNDSNSDGNANLFRYTTPSDCKAKWIAIQMFNTTTSEYTPITDYSTWKSNPTSYDSTIENLVSSKINGIWNRFITRFYPIHYRLCTTEHFCLPTYDRNDQGSYFNTLNTEAPYHDATWVLFGDSLTDNYGGKSAKGNYFASKVSRELGLTIDNRAKSGSNINDGPNGNYANVSGIKILDAFIAELQAETIEEPQYITIAFGSNSIISQLGTSSDSSSTKTTVCGAVKYFIETLRTNCPNAVIGFVLPPQSDWGSNSTTKSVEQGRNAILSVLQLDEYAVPYVDMWKESGITVGMLPDGIHISSSQAQNLYYHAIRKFMMGL